MRITDLPILYTASLNDILYVVNTDDTSDFISGSSKQITIGNFFSSSGVLGGGGGGGGYGTLSSINISSQKITANGLSSSYTITTNGTESSKDIFVFINGLEQIPTTNYTLSSSILIFSGIPSSGSSIEIRRFEGSILVTGSTYPITSSWSNESISSSYSFTSSYSLNAGSSLTTGSTYPITSSWSNYSISSSYSVSSSYTENSSVATNLSGGTVNATSITSSNISASGNINANSFTGLNASFNNITSSGPISLSGSNAYIQLFPITSSSIPSNFTASYIYTNKSTNDLYFTHYNGTHTSTTRLSWLDSNMYTGILFGGTLSSTPGSTTFNIASGSGLIVTMNATTGSDPNPTIKEIDWGNYTNIPIIYSSSAQITYVGIDSTGQIVQQTNAWGSADIDQWDAEINLGVVLHLSGSVSTGVFNSPQISYGYPQKTDDFIRAFGSLKISGHTIQASGSTLGITKTGGVAFREGANYNINPNHPSSVVENAITSSKIFRYYLSGSIPIIDTGVNNAGYPTLDITKYNNNGTLTSLSGSGASQFTIQRVFWIPNSPTNAFIVYYGNSVYGTLLDAQNGVNTEAFTEAPNTALNAIFTAYVITEGDCTDLITTGKSTIVQGGLFRSVGGIGAGGTSPATTDLNSLSDVAIAGPSQGDLLIYGNGTQWVNSKTLVGAYTLSGSLVTNDGITAVSINATSITGSLLGTSSLASNAISSSFSSVSVSSSYARTASNLSPVAQDLIPISNSLYSLGSPTNKWKDLYVSTGSIYIGDSVLSTSGSTLYSDALPIVTFNTSSGQIQVTGITSSLSSSFANTSSIALNTISSSYALSSSYARTASNSITANSATSASYALTSSYSFVANAAVTATSANTANSANAATSASYALTASFASNAGSSLTTGSTYPITASWSVSSSYVVNAGNSTSSSFASTASYVENSVSSSYALTASYALVAGSGGSGGSTSTSSLIGQTFVPTASVSQLSLTQSVSNNDQILVILDGLVQSRTGSYTVTGSTLNLTENADSGSIIDVRFLAGASTVSSSFATTSSYALTTAPRTAIYRYGTTSVVNPGSYAYTIIKYDTAVTDSTGWYDNTNGRFTPTVAGWYQVSAGARVYSSGGEGYLALRKNGTDIMSSGGGNAVNSVLSLLVYFNGSSDYIQLYSIAATAITNAQNSTNTPFTMVYMTS